MKLFFISTSFYVLYLMQTKYKQTWDPTLDTFKVEYLVGPAFFLALIINYEFTLMEVLRLFCSIAANV